MSHLICQSAQGDWFPPGGEGWVDVSLGWSITPEVSGYVSHKVGQSSPGGGMSLLGELSWVGISLG